ncbi:MAG: protein translocase subunit SecD [Clostridia bacterium]|nr:protein translocase subunit SecD [Clostridia bacterium]
MNKPTAIKRFIFIGIFLILGFILTFCTINVPFTDKTYQGFANSLKLGLDLKGGVLAIYEASPIDGDMTDFDSKVQATKTRILGLVSKEYSEAQVSIQGDTRIRVEVPDVSDPDEVFELIGQPATLEFRSSDQDDAEVILTGQNVKNAYASQDRTNGEYGVTVEFDDEGSTAFYNFTKEHVGDKLYIYINGELDSAPEIKDAISGGTTFISGSYENQEQADDFALRILSGTFSVNLALLENTVVSATLGIDALKWGLIGGLVGLILIFAFMIWRYRMMGVMACLALGFYVILMMFFLQAIPIVQLTLAGIAGVVLSIGMAIDGNIIVFERIKEEYRSGKRIEASIQSGFKRAMPSILDSNITTIISSLILLLLGSGNIQGFAVTLLIGIVLSMFTSLMVTRSLLKMYYPLNTNKAKHYALSREATVSELK